jgi:hypothetical protein
MISPLTTTTSPSLLEACITAVATYLPDQVNVSGAGSGLCRQQITSSLVSLW